MFKYNNLLKDQGNLSIVKCDIQLHLIFLKKMQCRDGKLCRAFQIPTALPATRHNRIVSFNWNVSKIYL